MCVELSETIDKINERTATNAKSSDEETEWKTSNLPIYSS